MRTGPIAIYNVPAIFYDKHHKDKYHNDVSILELGDGFKFKIVHHFTAWRRHQKYTVDAGRGKSLKLTLTYPASDCDYDTVDVGGYKCGWGDGDYVFFEAPDNANPTFVEFLKTHFEFYSQEDFITFVLNWLRCVDDAWSYKVVSAV